ncbi:hypothetical protein FEM03_05515 [Phragmitibacter flavus]|uniref:Uncharacterized protein n=1 Tax=Phragmitibacter flavus TaxID=2576071 RepID=A0A5R8KH86_9BACT|nr:hypothetical protein [Phragmitibacter flavus]TLD71600.1 hypothetical protein FEM03_05515 [Phragmitibacter flavus]
MNRSNLPVTWIIAGLLVASVCWYFAFPQFYHPEDRENQVPVFEAAEIAALLEFRKAQSTSTRIEIYEGLPHSFWETDSYEQQRTTANVRKVQENHFYADKLTPSKTDASILNTLILNPQSFVKHQGPKLCGGFHADWLIEWESPSGERHQLHLCFGCGEAAIYGPKHQLHCELSNNADSRFQLILSSYAKNRPPDERIIRRK